MQIDPALKARVEQAFAPLNDQAAAHAFPPPTSLSQRLNASLPAGSTGVAIANVTPATATMFTTAAVNAWLRAVHSFLISASLTTVSPVWTSVAGYYSSHYAVRALAHLLGFFQLFARRRIVRLELQAGRYVCSFNPKKGGDREHRIYWDVEKGDKHFVTDPFFAEYNPSIDESDVAHRDRVNYADHISEFPVFRPLDAVSLRNRVNRISEIEITLPPIPRVSRCPDVESVQIIAYHRLIRFRDLVDTVIGNGNRFWNVYRNPAWAREFMDFQLTEEATLRSEFTL